MDAFQKVADSVVFYRIRSAWLEISKMYNELASEKGGTLAMAFVLLAINEEDGTPVTKIAPRLGMEPNSLSRLLKSLEKKGCIYKRKERTDKRKVFICLTEYGLEVRRSAWKAVFRLNSSIVDGLAPEKLEAFFEVMDHLPAAMVVFKKKMEESPVSFA